MMSYLIYMAIRLMEMKRLLKSTGSIYLHCDPTAGHYLKLLMDAVFGVQFYKNDVVWKRTARGYKGSQHKPRRFNTNTDSILFYGGRNAYFDMDSVLEPYDPEVYGKTFRFHDEKGPYYFDVAYNRPSASPRPNLCYEYRGFWPPHESGWKVGRARMEELDKRGDIVVRNGKLQRKVRPGGGRIRNNLWDDIGEAKGRERTDYPTQKPVALIERIIRASSKVDDVVLDPFCGCATACIAAEKAERQWVGIDISPKAKDLVVMRLENELGYFGGDQFTIHRTDIPMRTDLGRVIQYNSIRNKRYLYGEQGGYCNGCELHFEMRNFTVDHIIAKAHGGTDHISNLQLLCGACNSIKGTKSHEELLVLLTDKGWVKRRHAA